jgi:hypothetical protein
LKAPLDVRSKFYGGQAAGLLVAVRINGGIGDCVVIARFLRDLSAQTEPLVLDIFYDSPQLAAWVFASLPECRSVRDATLWPEMTSGYPVALSVSQFVLVETTELPPPRLLRECPRFGTAVKSIMRFRSKIDIMVERHPYMDGFLAQTAVYMNFTRADFLHAMAGIAYSGPRLALPLDDHVIGRWALSGRPYITINNGFDVSFVMGSRSSTKCYPHFAEVVRLLKARYRGLIVVQLGASSSTPIPGVDVGLVGATSLAEAAAIISSAILHVDNEGGLVHIASSLGVRSCVIFGPTSADYFSYPENINLRPGFCGGCWWTNMTWMERCPRGFGEARCMHEQSPEAVVEAVRSHLDAALTEKAGGIETESRGAGA